MSNLTLGIIVYFVLMFSWMMYLIQEMFITGSGALNIILSKDEGERKQIQVSTGIHWDGIEVWLLTSLMLMLAAFPDSFALTFEHLYVPIFLLLFALIGRGVSIEMIYKLDDKSWIKAMKHTWTISSILIIFILGIYMTNLFYGFVMDQGEITGSFMSLFSVPSIVGGLFFTALAITAGAGWISFTTSGSLGERAMVFIKKAGVIYTVPVLLLLIFMGLNNINTSIFIGELYSSSILFFIFPLLTVASAVMVVIKGLQEKGKCVFRFSLLTMAFYIITGFTGNYPYVLSSRDGFMNGLDIEAAMSSSYTLTIILIVIVVFFPLVMFYQGWKYRKFTRERIHYNDGMEE